MGYSVTNPHYKHDDPSSKPYLSDALTVEESKMMHRGVRMALGTNKPRPERPYWVSVYRVLIVRRYWANGRKE